MRTGNVLLQEQAYLTRPSQTLFHRQTAAGTDAEAFDFGRAADGTIGLAQTNAAATDATDTGFYTATFSFLKFDNPTATGYLHTTIGDPIHTTTPIFSSLIFPEMIETAHFKPVQSIGPGEGILSEKNDTTQNGNRSALTAPSLSAVSGAWNAARSNMTTIEPIVKNEVSTEVGVEDTTNILALTATPTPAPAAKPAGNVTNTTGRAGGAAEQAIGKSNILPESKSLLTRPMNRQSNKPFTEAMDPDYNPRKATRDEIQNISGWDRFTTNVIGRSGIDSTYMNRTSYPSYINPWNVVKLADQYPVMSDSMNMTKSGSWLNPRMWAL